MQSKRRALVSSWRRLLNRYSKVVSFRWVSLTKTTGVDRKKTQRGVEVYFSARAIRSISFDVWKLSRFHDSALQPSNNYRTHCADQRANGLRAKRAGAKITPEFPRSPNVFRDWQAQNTGRS